QKRATLRALKTKHPQRLIEQKWAGTESCIWAFINDQIEAQKHKILDSLLNSPDGRGFLHVHLPNNPEIQIEFHLEGFTPECGYRIVGVIEEQQIQ
ncbi:unnamed protein product, partial [marine sediment metagenome]